MNKFNISEFTKSFHAVDQQDSRSMSDYEIERVLNFGTPSYDEALQRFTYKLGPQTVVLCMTSKVIITVHPGDRAVASPKLKLVRSAPCEEAEEMKPALVELERDITDEYLSGEYFKRVA